MSVNMRPIVESVSIMSCIAVVAVVVFWLLTGCTPGRPVQTAVDSADVARYAAELKACEERFPANDCAGYLECRHSVQRAHKQPETLSCDGGAP